MDVRGVLVAAAVLVLATVVGRWRRRVDGRLRPAAAPVGPPLGTPGPGAEVVPAELLAALGVTPAPATLLQFSTAFCAPCRATRRVCGEVVDLLPVVRHVEVDAESHLAAVRALNVWRTPTVLVLDAAGRVVRRATGIPSRAQVIAVLGEILPGPPGPPPGPAQ